MGGRGDVRGAALLLLLGSACATAHEAGKEAAAGAIAGASEQAPASQGQGSQLAKATEGVSQGAVSGLLQQLRDPGARQELAAVAGQMAGAAARQATAGALAAMDDPAQRARLAAMSQQLGAGAAEAFTTELARQLGPGGDGPLARSLAASAGRVAGASVQGADDALAGVWPGCRGPERAACVQQRIAELSRTAAVSAGEGLRQGLGAIPLLLAFGGGILVTLLALAALSSLATWRQGLRLARRQPA